MTDHATSETMSEGNLAILAGGISSRMRKPAMRPIDPEIDREADAKSKSMISVGPGNRPFLDYLLFNAREAGYTDIVIVIGERDQWMRSYYGGADRGNPFHGMTISYAVQPIPQGRAKPLGTADAFLRALQARTDWSGERVTVCNSDNLYSREAFDLIRRSPFECAAIDYDRSALRFDQAKIEQFAVLVKDGDGALLEIVEKPGSADMARARDRRGRVGVSMNLWRFRCDRILPYLERVPLHPERQEKELPGAVMMMIRVEPRSVMTIPLAEHVPDLSSKDDIREVQEFLARTYPNFSFERSSE
jgi:glucose-1-phosphate adenylyltransferase